MYTIVYNIVIDTLWINISICWRLSFITNWNYRRIAHRIWNYGRWLLSLWSH